jgi:NAD(P)H-quinone oxidoreductase subunit I
LKFERYGKGIASGMAITMKHFFRKPITTQYPEERLDVSRRFRGNQLIWIKEKCSACGACQRACPVNCLNLTTSRGEDKKLHVDIFKLDIGLCIFCGLCVESCPTHNLFMSTDYEKFSYNREALKLAGDDLAPSEKRIPSGYCSSENEAKMPKQTLLINRK